MKSLVETLTRRERDVFDLLVQGYENKEIAVHLSITVDGVKYHLTGIFRKLGVRSRGEAIIYGLQTAEEVPSITDGRAFTETEIREAAKHLVTLELADKKLVNQVVLDLLGVLGGKL